MMNKLRFLAVLLPLFIAACASQIPYKSTIERPDNIVEIHKRILNEAYSKGVETDQIVSAELIGDEHGISEPIIKASPQYPNEAVEGRIEGWVTLIYTINTLGEPVDVNILENSDTDIFNEASKNAVRKFIYKPVVINGKIVSVSGVTNRFSYEFGE